MASPSAARRSSRLLRPAYEQRTRPKPGEETAEALLASVPGISTTSARVLLERFGSVAAVVAADPAEWLAVPGIGRERARALEETFNLRRRTKGRARTVN
ncbi:MAG: helix-hairpin-helix domain-containing protein [Gaiellaceae bacterium]